MDTADAAAQLDAMVGKAKYGFFKSMLTSFAVSMALPPPTAKIISASLTASMASSRRAASNVHSFPNKRKDKISISVPSTAASSFSLEAPMAFSPPMTTAFVPYRRVYSAMLSYAFGPTV